MRSAHHRGLPGGTCSGGLKRIASVRDERRRRLDSAASQATRTARRRAQCVQSNTTTICRDDRLRNVVRDGRVEEAAFPE